MAGKLIHFDGPLAFTADDLLRATAEIMGKSTYGTVYKAMLEGGSMVDLSGCGRRSPRARRSSGLRRWRSVTSGIPTFSR